jgi:hypothetical protein
MLDSALEDMQRDAAENLTIFLNHSYDIPEDVGGSVIKAQMHPRGADGEGNPIWDLDFDVLVNKANPRAIQTHDSIEAGTKLGLSIGAMIPEGGAVRDKKTGAYTISHVKLLETSIVGIPANPRSWVQNAIKSWEDGAVKKATTTPLGSPMLTLDGPHYTITGTLDSEHITVSSGFTLETAGVTPDELAAAPPAVDPELTDADSGTCPNCGGSKGNPKGGCQNSYHKGGGTAPTNASGDDAVPDVTDAKIQVITIDTDDGGSSEGSGDSQGDGSDDGDSDFEDSTTPDVVADAQAALLGNDGTVLVTQLQSVLDLLAKTTTQLVEERKARGAAEAERDRVLQETSGLVEQMSLTIEAVGNLPMGRKASFKVLERDFSHLEGTYSASFIKMLNKGDTP